MAERRDVEVVIVGQGIAGSSLAWALMDRGVDPLVIDDRRQSSASSVAAGLITPVTGAKLRLQPQFSFLASAASLHYRAVEAATGVQCYTPRPAFRLLSNDRELAVWDEADAALRAELELAAELPSHIKSTGVAVRMPSAARVDTQRYLEAVHIALCDRGLMLGQHVEPDDISVTDNGIELARLGVRARHVVFCRGYGDHDNSFFKTPAWRPAKGQVLTIRSEQLGLTQTVHAQGIWITPIDGATYLAGASYEWDTLDDRPTAEAKESLCEKIDEIINTRYTVVDHRAAVRPIVSGRRPICGPSPTSPNVWLFNGLSSKGALFAPFVATQVAGSLTKGIPIDDAYRLDRRTEDTWDDG